MKCKSTSRNCDRQSCPITPYRFMFVLGALLALAGTGWSQASRPLIARITAAAGGSVAQVYGEGFEPRKVEARALPLKANAALLGEGGWVGAADPRSEGAAIGQ